MSMQQSEIKDPSVPDVEAQLHSRDVGFYAIALKTDRGWSGGIAFGPAHQQQKPVVLRTERTDYTDPDTAMRDAWVDFSGRLKSMFDKQS